MKGGRVWVSVQSKNVFGLGLGLGGGGGGGEGLSDRRDVLRCEGPRTTAT